MLLFIILDKQTMVWYTLHRSLQVDTEVIKANQNPEVAIAGSVIPYHRDDDRARYLGYLACGFSVREALHMIEKSKSTLSAWRHSEQFVDLENRIPEIRKELSREYVSIEFFRNFRLVLQKDFEVLQRSLLKDEDGLPVTLTAQDQSYLIKMRANYTPQQLSILEAIAGTAGAGDFDFARFIAENPDIVQVQRTDVITMAKGKDGS